MNQDFLSGLKVALVLHEQRTPGGLCADRRRSRRRQRNRLRCLAHRVCGNRNDLGIGAASVEMNSAVDAIPHGEALDTGSELQHDAREVQPDGEGEVQVHDVL
jgi:hypothetical protein